jgi:hypothetical protein
MIATGGVMKMKRFEYKGFSGWGSLRDGLIYILNGDIYKDPVETKETIPEEVKITCPVLPSKIIAVGFVYFAMAKLFPGL